MRSIAYFLSLRCMPLKVAAKKSGLLFHLHYSSYIGLEVLSVGYYGLEVLGELDRY